MTITIPDDLLKQTEDQAKWRNMTIECAIREALTEWLKSEQEVRDELALWQHAGVETLRRVEESMG